MILDAVQDDIESIVQIAYSVDFWRRVWEHDFDEADIIAEIRALVEEGLLEPYDTQLREDGHVLELVEDPPLSDDDIRRYWYEPTPAGVALWERWDPPEPPPPSAAEQD